MANPNFDPNLGHSDQKDRVHGQADLVETNDLEKRSPRGSPIDAASSELATSANRNEYSAGWDTAKEVDWDGPSDPSFPRNFPVWRKWAIVSITSSTALCVTCTSSLYTSTYEQLEKEFDCSQIVATLGLSLFILGLGLGPMLLGPLSEFYGRWVMACLPSLGEVLCGRSSRGRGRGRRNEKRNRLGTAYYLETMLTWG